MGAGASALPVDERIDKETAQRVAGDKYDEAAFDKAADGEGTVSRDDFFKAAETLAARADLGATSADVRTWDAQKAQAAVTAAAQSLIHDKRSDFLGAEVKATTSQEQTFINAWTALNGGDTASAIECASDLIASNSTHEKAYYTRAVAYARQANWRYALNDYSAYLKLLQQTSGPNLANALYGRALCLAKLGKRQLALKDLDECIRVGPEDEQVTDPNASLVPVAIIARFALLHACPELRKARNAAMAAQAQAAADEAKGKPSASSADADKSSYEGAVWNVLATDLEVAVERCLASGKTPLLLDNTNDKAVDAYYLYASAMIIEAKKTVLEVRSAGVTLEKARESLREPLMQSMKYVHACKQQKQHITHHLLLALSLCTSHHHLPLSLPLTYLHFLPAPHRYGHTLVVRMANSAADFLTSYCSPEAFPLQVFEQPVWPNDTPLELSSSSPFAKVLKEKDLTGGKFHVNKDFRVVVTSTFKPESYERFLKESLPLDKLQAICICDRVSGETKFAAPHLMMKGRTADGDQNNLTEDRTTLLAERRQADEEERENALAKVSSVAADSPFRG